MSSVHKMEIELMPLSLAIIVSNLLLLVQLPAIPASGFVTQSRVCKDHFAYANSNGQDLFYINGNSVEKALFCEALHTYHANGCILEGDLGSNRCGSVISLGIH